MENLIKDLRYGIRSLLKQPAFTLVAVSTLAAGNRRQQRHVHSCKCGIAAAASISGSKSIVVLEGINPPRGITQSNMSIPDFADWQNQNQVFEQMAGFVAGGCSLIMATRQSECTARP